MRPEKPRKGMEVPLMRNRVIYHETIQPPDESSRIIHLTQGQFAIVDAEDYEPLMKWKWSVKRQVRGGSIVFYARRSVTVCGRSKTIYMHRQLTGFHGEAVDHLNWNSLDNRKSNLSPGTISANRKNRNPVHKGKARKRKDKFTISFC